MVSNKPEEGLHCLVPRVSPVVLHYCIKRPHLYVTATPCDSGLESVHLPCVCAKIKVLPCTKFSQFPVMIVAGF